MIVEKLTEDFTDSLGAEYVSQPVSPAKHEAPAMFQRNGYYYLMYGHTCCFCKEGASASVVVAKSPLGPWEDAGYDLNPKKSAFSSYHEIAG